MHDLMISGWQKHVAETLGRTLRSSDRLLACLDDIISHAELEGGARPPAMLQLALHNAIGTVESAAPPTPFSQAEQHAEEQRPQTGSKRSRDASANDPEAPKAESVSESQNDGHEGTPARSEAPCASQPPSKRFTKAEHFFLHHTLQVKQGAAEAGWIKTSKKPSAKELARAEWIKMDFRTRSEWERLFCRWQGGDKATLELATTAQLFDHGNAICLWSNAGTASPVAEPSKKKRRKEKDATPTPQKEVPPFTPPMKVSIRPAGPRSRIDQYWPVTQSEHVNFLALDQDKSVPSNTIANACKATVTTNVGHSMNTLWQNHQVNDQNIFTIRWRDVKAARRLEGSMIKFSNTRARAQAFPSSPPQIFVAHMNHLSENGVRLDAVHPAIVSVIPDQPCHLRHEQIERSHDTVWIAVLEQPPGCLRFEVGIPNKVGGHKIVAFEPLMRNAACPVCHKAHSAVECEALVRAGRKELKVKKGDESYLAKMPELA